MFDPAFPNSKDSDNTGRCSAMTVPQFDGDLPPYRPRRHGGETGHCPSYVRTDNRQAQPDEMGMASVRQQGECPEAGISARAWSSPPLSTLMPPPRDRG